MLARCGGDWLLVPDHFLELDTSPGEQRSSGGHPVTLFAAPLLPVVRARFVHPFELA